MPPAPQGLNEVLASGPARDGSFPPPAAAPAGEVSGPLSPRLGSPLLPEPLPDPDERTLTFLGTSSVTGHIFLDLPASARLQVGGQLGVRIGNLQYTGFDLGGSTGDNALSFDLTSAQRGAWSALRASAGSIDSILGSPALETIAAAISGLRDPATGLPTAESLPALESELRALAAGLETGQIDAPAIPRGLDPALVRPFVDTLHTLIENFYYERPGEAGLRNLELRGEATGSTASQYRFVTAGGDQIFAEITRGLRASTESSFGARVLFPDDGAGATLRTRLDRRSFSSSTSLNSFTVGRNRWSLAVTEISQQQRLSVGVSRFTSGLEAGDGVLDRSDHLDDRTADQIENRVWALRRSHREGWDVELGVGVGGLESRVQERTSTRGFAGSVSAADPVTPSVSSATTPAAATLLSGADLVSAAEALDPSLVPAAEGEALDFESQWSEDTSRSSLGGSLLVGARRDDGSGELGVRAIYFGRLQQQLTAAFGRRLPLGRLGLVGDLQADVVRQPGVSWEDGKDDFTIEAVSGTEYIPTGAVVWSLEDGALASLHAWQSPFEFTARRRDPRRLGRALFAGASGRQGDELFAGMSFGAGSYVSASMRQGTGSFRNFTLSGRARTLLMEVGMGSGRRGSDAAQDSRQEVSLSYLQFVYNRDGDRFFSLTLNPQTRGLDVAMTADSRSLAVSLGRAWTRFRRCFGL